MARRPSYRDHAVVVRTYDFGEADRIIVLLTRAHGLVRGVAKGVRRAKSRFGSRLQPFVLLDVQLYSGRNLDTITAADTLEFFGAGIIEVWENYTSACAVLESAEKLAVAHYGEDPTLFDAVVQALREIQELKDSEGEQYPTLIVDRFLLQAMAHEGWSPSLFNCAACNNPGPHRSFHPGHGGAVCGTCRPPGSPRVHPETLHLMWLLLHDSELDTVPENFPTLVAEAHQLTRSYLQWHLERSIASLKVMDQ